MIEHVSGSAAGDRHEGGRRVGTVTSSPSGIRCGRDCTEAYDAGTLVSLTAAAGKGSRFTGWSGACFGAGTCRVAMDDAKEVVATPSRPGAARPAGDLDGDGRPDLLWHNGTTGALEVWLLEGGATRVERRITPEGLADTAWQVRGVAGMNGDGHGDILWQHRTTGDRIARVAARGSAGR
jgi:hypothetical protein